MERKYYLRGLGIGIAMTAIIMGISLSGDKSMSNDEIIARAKELGMVENTVLSKPTDEEEKSGNTENVENEQDIADNPQDTLESNPDDIAATDDIAEDDEGDSRVDNDSEDQPDSEDAGVEDSETEYAEITGEEENNPEENEESEGGEPEPANGTVASSELKVITINSGDGSYTVAKKLADVGVITSAKNFDTYLCENGYDKRLRTGTYSIPADASDEQIARIVTGRE